LVHQQVNLRGVIREMDRLYPGLGHHLEEETTVAIDGQIHETAYFQPIPPAAKSSSSQNLKAVKRPPQRPATQVYRPTTIRHRAVTGHATGIDIGVSWRPGSAAIMVKKSLSCEVAHTSHRKNRRQ
jgi:hypothetical protein